MAVPPDVIHSKIESLLAKLKLQAEVEQNDSLDRATIGNSSSKISTSKKAKSIEGKLR